MNLRSRRGLDELHRNATELLLGCRAEIAGRDAERSIRIALATTLALCRESIVLRDRTMPGSLELSDEALADELTGMMHGYLTGAQS